jgi:hypothetical protein
VYMPAYIWGDTAVFTAFAGLSLVAEGVGFEPTVPLQARRFSRPVP